MQLSKTVKYTPARVDKELEKVFSRVLEDFGVKQNSR